MHSVDGKVKRIARQAMTACLLLSAIVLVLGSGVAFAAQAPSASPALAASPAQGGNGPDTAFSTPSGWVTTVPGTSTWYAFQYAGDKSQILIDMQVYPINAASYTVWTPQNAQGWRAGQIVTPVGGGSPNQAPSNSTTCNANRWQGLRSCAARRVPPTPMI